MFRQRFIKILMIPASLAIFVLIAHTAIARQSWHRRPKTQKTAPAKVEAAQTEKQAEPAALEESTEKQPPDFKDEFTMELIGGPQGHGVLKLTLDECVQRALERNMQLKAADKNIEAAQGQLIEAKAQFWPVLEYKYRMAPVPTDVDDAWSKFWEGEVTFFNSIHVGIGVPLVTFGQLHMAKKLAQGGVEAARIRSRQAESDVVYQVKQLYYGIQFAKETIKLLEEAIEKISNKLESNGEEEEEAEEELGEEMEEEDPLGLDPYDKIQLKAFRTELERQLERAKQNLELAYDGMRIQLDLEPGTEILLDSTQLKPKLASLDREEQFVDGGMVHQPEVKLLDIGVETKRRQYKLEKYKLLPRLGFGFFVDVGRTTGAVQGLQLTDDFNDPFNYTRAGIGLELRGTIDFHGAYGRLKKARAEYHKAAYERMIARRALTLDIRKAYLEAKKARENVARTKKEWSMANQMMFLSRVNLDIGVGDRDRYTDALKYVLLSRGRYFKAVFDYNMALASLEKRIGRERYDEYIPTPDIDELDAFEYKTNGEEEDEGGWITIDGEGDTYGRETEDGGTTGGFED